MGLEGFEFFFQAWSVPQKWKTHATREIGILLTAGELFRDRFG